MKISVIKLPGGVLSPSSDIDESRMARFTNHCEYEVEIKQKRNPKFHGKVMAFIRYCFNYVNSDEMKDYQFKDTPEQFDRFRYDLTILAGYYIQTVRLDGSIRTEAESLDFGNMDETEFQGCYHALINAAMKHIFKDCEDEDIYNKLIGFF